jgi:hypothetical protein
MEDIVEFVKSLGGLHDSKLLKLVWLLPERRLDLHIKDIWWNSEGHPEYPGPTPAMFVFTDVSKFDVNVGDFCVVGHMIYDWTFQKTGTPNYVSEIAFSPGGKIIVECDHIECVQQPAQGQP